MRLNYLKLTIKHKWFVFRAGLKLGVSIWRLLMHDVSKLSRAEYTHYQRWFFEDKNDPEGFAKAWIHHQNANAHHWEYWITRSSHAIGTAGPAGAKPCPMPEKYVREMVADWIGASLAYTGKPDIQEWVDKNWHKMNLHEDTSKCLDKVLKEQGWYWPGS